MMTPCYLLMGSTKNSPLLFCFAGFGTTKPFLYFSTKGLLTAQTLGTDLGNVGFGSKACTYAWIHSCSHTHAHLLLQTGFTQHRDGRHLVGKAGPQGCGDTLAQVSIIKDDGGVFASQFQRQPLAVWSTFLHDPLGRHCTSREGDQKHIRMADKGFSCLGACSKHYVHHPVGHP